MLQTIAIGVLLCVIGIEAVAIRVLLRKLRDSRREVASWKLAVESYEKEQSSW